MEKIKFHSLIIGSTAIKHWFPDYDKEPKDVDLICKYLPSWKEEGVEFYTSETMRWIIDKNIDGLYVDPDILYTIKISHIFWDLKNNSWWKHLKDIVFLQNKGCRLNRNVYRLLYDEWLKLHGEKGHISLNKTVDMFFKDGVRREYDHDWLHEYFCIGDEPAYKAGLIRPDSPMMCKKYWDEAEHYYKIKCALEEMFIVSFERKISLPSAFKSIITKMTKGWFPLFMVMNAKELLDGFQEEKQEYKNKILEIKESYNEFRKHKDIIQTDS